MGVVYLKMYEISPVPVLVNIIKQSSRYLLNLLSGYAQKPESNSVSDNVHCFL